MTPKFVWWDGNIIQCCGKDVSAHMACGVGACLIVRLHSSKSYEMKQWRARICWFLVIFDATWIVTHHNLNLKILRIANSSMIDFHHNPFLVVIIHTNTPPKQYILYATIFKRWLNSVYLKAIECFTVMLGWFQLSYKLRHSHLRSCQSNLIVYTTSIVQS